MKRQKEKEKRTRKRKRKRKRKRTETNKTFHLWRGFKLKQFLIPLNI